MRTQLVALCLLLGAAGCSESSTPTERPTPPAPPTESPDSPSFEVYRNGRFGYSVKYPTECIPQPESQNGDGRVFLCPNGAELRVWGSWGGLHDNAASAFKAEKASRGNVTYELQKADWFVISGIQDKQVYYEKQFVTENGVSAMQLRYPQSQKGQFDPLTTTISRSLTRTTP